jgi:hypothetical protein
VASYVDDIGEVINGFRLSNPNIGTLTSSTKWNCINYNHNKSGKQIIEFIEDMAWRRSYIEVIGTIHVHDHASIPQGGPAYATYFAEE